jgi:hypothetical protein
MIDKNKNPFDMSEEEKKKQIDDMWSKYENKDDSDSFERNEFEFFNDEEY